VGKYDQVAVVAGALSRKSMWRSIPAISSVLGAEAAALKGLASRF
jgi:hypothetical protein